MQPERRIHGVQLVGASGGTVSLDCWAVTDASQRANRGPFDVGSNDVWTLPASDGLHPVSHAEAVGLRTCGLPNFHAHQLKDVIEAIRQGQEPMVTGVDGRRVVAIIQGVYESGRTGRPVKLTD
jgi:predicted dehydrogenase